MCLSVRTSCESDGPRSMLRIVKQICHILAEVHLLTEHTHYNYNNIHKKEHSDMNKTKRTHARMRTFTSLLSPSEPSPSPPLPFLSCGVFPFLVNLSDVETTQALRERGHHVPDSTLIKHRER